MIEGDGEKLRIVTIDVAFLLPIYLIMVKGKG